MAGGPTVEISGLSVRYRFSPGKPATLQEYLILRLKGRRPVYKDFWALKDLTLNVGRGKALGVIGPNGAGKSTLLKVVAGVFKPTEGEVRVHGRVAPLIELGAGFDHELTGAENIYLNASIMGFSKKEIDRKVNDIIDFAELRDFIHQPLRSYSTGMIARLGFAIMTEVDPDIVVVDEVLSVGDEHFRKKCEARLRDFKGRGVTIFLVSHWMEEIEAVCDEVLWLERGSMRMQGEPQAVIGEYLKTV